MKLVKTLSSTKWSSIYSAESKYKLTVNPSLTKAVCWSAFTLINLLLIFWLLSIFYQLTRSILIAGVIANMIICWRVFLKLNAVQVQTHYHLDDQGQWYWLNKVGDIERWQITDTSRVAIYGCYLTLSAIKDVDNKLISIEQQFLFKDSLSVEDYARLCRVIRRINFEGSQTVPK